VVKRPVKRPVIPDLLLVCRANRARSPIAVELLRQNDAEQRITPPPTITRSGVNALRGQALLSSMQDALKRKHRPEIDHRSRPFSLRDANGARLVITFERELVRTIVNQNPALVPRTFTLGEIVRLSSSPRWEREWNGSADIGARLHALRPLVEPGDDDTPDPVSGRRRVSRKVLDMLVRDIGVVAPVLLGEGHSGVAEPEAP
jgi:protein-tyrosine-phosphatase